MLDDEERDYDWKLEFGFYPDPLRHAHFRS